MSYYISFILCFCCCSTLYTFPFLFFWVVYYGIVDLRRQFFWCTLVYHSSSIYFPFSPSVYILSAFACSWVCWCSCICCSFVVNLFFRIPLFDILVFLVFLLPIAFCICLRAPYVCLCLLGLGRFWGRSGPWIFFVPRLFPSSFSCVFRKSALLNIPCIGEFLFRCWLFLCFE